jgi:hypothetical protein
VNLTVEEIGAFLATPPPREIPKGIREQAFKGSATRFLILFGLIFLLVGGFASWMLKIWRIPCDMALDLGETRSAEATILSSVSTNVSVGGSSGSSGTPIYEVRFRFIPEDGEEISGVNYTTGSRYRRGNRTEAIYLEGYPAICRLSDASYSMTGYPGLAILLFPLAGGGLAFFSWRKRRRRLRLLRDGRFTTGSVRKTETTGMQINNKRVHRIHVHYKAGGEERDTHYTGFGEDAKYADAKLEAGEPIGLLYDPDAPERVLAADSLIERESY